MIILVDFENTHVSGLDGYEYLNDSDTLVMYYSDENSAVNKGMVTDLKKRNVHVSLVKLLKQHSNALDMYIASTTGMFLESGEKICIVSKDKGYAAVRDFWHSLRGAEILLGETIKECFLNSEKNDDERIRLCKERAQKATLVDSFATMNTIPTRPTLSRANQRRRNRNINFTEVSEPASLIPNPLMFETPADQLVKQMKEMPFGRVPEASFTDNRRNLHYSAPEGTDSESRTSGNENSDSKISTGKQEDKTVPENNGKRHSDSDNSRSRDRRRQDNRRRDNGNQSERNTQKTEAPSSDTIKETVKQETPKDDSAAIVKSEPEKTAIIIRPEQKTAITKSEPKYDPNRVQFVYDPVSRSMKKVGEADEKTEVQKSSVNTAKDSDSSQDSNKSSEDHDSDARASQDNVSDTRSSEMVKADASRITSSKMDSSTEETVKETENEIFAEDNNPNTTQIGTAAIETSETLTEAADTDAFEASDKVSETIETPAGGKEVIEDSSSKSEDVKSEEKKGRKRTTSRKSASKRKASKKSSSSEEAKLSEAAVTSETEVTSEVSDEAGSENKAAEKKRSKKTAGKSRKTKTAASEDKADEKKSEKKPAKKSGRKSSVKKAESSTDSEKEAADEKSGKTPQIVSSDEAVQKYGLTANTLHTYYVRLIKAYGREQGKAVYDMSKKAVQEDIKKRKAAEKAAEVSAE